MSTASPGLPRGLRDLRWPQASGWASPRSWLGIVAIAAFFIAASVAVQIGVGAYRADLGTSADEAGHFVSSLLIYDYFRSGLFHTPMQFAKDYYLHWPRVSIGHWPPLFYAMQAAIFAIGGRSVASALAVQALVAGAAAAWSGCLVWRRFGLAAGLAAGIVVFSSPFLLFSVDLVMLDTVLGLWMMAAALAWAGFARRPSLARALVFAGCASGAILTKGNGLALVLLPILYAALSRSVGPLRDWRAWLSAAVIGLATAPWYILTYRLAAAGFVYRWGWDYTHKAIPFFLWSIPANLGAIGTAGLVAGIASLARRPSGEMDSSLVALSALVLALLLFQVCAPADLSPRYLIPLVPAAAVVASQGLADIIRLTPLRSHARLSAAALTVLLLINSAALFRMPHTAPFGMTRIARQILSAGGNNVAVLAAGNDHAEGALTAAFATADPQRRFYVLRASQQLATDNFMGSSYTPRFQRDDDVARWLLDSGIGWLSIDSSPEGLAMQHNRQLTRVLQRPSDGWALVDRSVGPRGEVRLYRLDRQPTRPDQMRALLERAAPSGLP